MVNLWRIVAIARLEPRSLDIDAKGNTALQGLLRGGGEIWSSDGQLYYLCQLPIVLTCSYSP